jgi:hypothetical protein
MHRDDATQYVRFDKSGKSKRRTIIWTDRLSSIIFKSYGNFLDVQHPGWETDSFLECLSTTWTIPTTDSIISDDWTAFFVQLGLLVLVQESEDWKALGMSLQAVTAQLEAGYGKFQREVVLAAANVSECKSLSGGVQPSPDRSGDGRGRGRGNGDRGQGDRGRGGGRRGAPGKDTVYTKPLPPAPRTEADKDKAAPPTKTNGSVLASTIPAALAAGIEPNANVWTKCMAPGCTSTGGPKGFSKGPMCFAHYGR